VRTVILLGWGVVIAVATVVTSAQAEFNLGPQDYDNSAIVIAEPANDIQHFAAAELQDHLARVTGHTIQILVGEASCDHCFYIGGPAPGDDTALAEEEARYAVTPQAIYLYGSDRIRVSGERPAQSILGSGAMQHNQVGTLFAVYLFLEEQLGVRWLEPGEAGIVAPPRSELRLPITTQSWQSPFTYQRNLRSYAWRGADEPAVYLPDAFVLSTEDALSRRAELELWLRRMRMGARDHLNFGHAFHDWWEAHGEEHPEYFALNGNGVRGPLSRDRPDRVKMCVSQPGVVKQALEDWLVDREANLWSSALGVGVNDGGGGGAAEYCHCDACLALDVPKEGEPFGDHLSDRYMYLANQALRAARQQVPDAQVTAYAYAVTEQPPRRERLEDGVVLQFVTTMADPFDDVRGIYDGWQEMGATQFMFRPNDLCVELGLPLGLEKRIWAHQQIAVSRGAKGTDHDSVYGFWTGMSGLTYYVLARSHIDPSRPFEDWVAEYTATFGAAQPEVDAWFTHWRRKFEEVILPANGDTRSDGGRGFLRWNGLGGISTRVREFYDESDFDKTDSLLAVAAKRELSDEQRRNLQRLQLGNRHNRLTFEAMEAVNRADTADSRSKAEALLAFRHAVRDSLRVNWRVLFNTQHQMGDATGITALLVEPRIKARQSFEVQAVSQAPTIDGLLDERIWSTAGRLADMVNNATAAKPDAATDVYVAWDREGLYVGLSCSEPLIDDVIEQTAERDGPAWLDNAVEIFIDGRSSRRDFHQFVVTSGGALLDGRKENGVFSSDWDAELGEELEYAVARTADGWSAEMRVSWAALEMSAPQSGDQFRFNITRDRNVSVAGRSEASALSPTFGGFHAPARFTTLTLR
jgi:hypothetical protein